MAILRERPRGSNKSRSVSIVQALVATSLLLVGHTTCAIPLLDGRYETETDVQDILNLALDAAQMKEATTFAEKEQIYISVRANDTVSSTVHVLPKRQQCLTGRFSALALTQKHKGSKSAR